MLSSFPYSAFLGWFSMDVALVIFPQFHQWSMDIGEATIGWIVEHKLLFAMGAVLLTAYYFSEDVWNLCNDANHSISRFFSNRRSF